MRVRTVIAVLVLLLMLLCFELSASETSLFARRVYGVGILSSYCYLAYYYHWRNRRSPERMLALQRIAKRYAIGLMTAGVGLIIVGLAGEVLVVTWIISTGRWDDGLRGWGQGVTCLTTIAVGVVLLKLGKINPN
jgi:hypothetical protein